MTHICPGFQWDGDHAPKNWERHRVKPEEAEDVFFNAPLIVRSDTRHSKLEIRLPAAMIEDLKILANKRDVPYQSLLKVFLAERLEKERRRA